MMILISQVQFIARVHQHQEKTYWQLLRLPSVCATRGPCTTSIWLVQPYGTRKTQCIIPVCCACVAFLPHLQVLREGMYDVAAIYSSSRQAPFKLSVGMHNDIQAGRSLALRVQLPAQVCGSAFRCSRCQARTSMLCFVTVCTCSAVELPDRYQIQVRGCSIRCTCCQALKM